jgi:hypothetical protein
MNPNVEGAASLFSDEKVDPTKVAPVHLVSLLVPDDDTAKRTGQPMSVDEAFRKFYAKTKKPEDAPRVARDRIQDRLILASDELCFDYKRRLLGKRAGYNTWLGSLAILLAGGATIANAAETARRYAAAAGSAGGIRAEINSNLFGGDEVMRAVFDGIDTKRAERFKEIRKARFADPEGKSPSRTIEEYSVEAAVADAIKFHDSCSLTAGIGAVTKAQQTINILEGDSLGKMADNVLKLRTKLLDAKKAE